MLSAGRGATQQEGVVVRLGRSVETLLRRSDGIEVTLRSAPDGAMEKLVVDRIIALTGSVGDHTLYRQLQVHECWATSGPMKLAAALLASSAVAATTRGIGRPYLVANSKSRWSWPGTAMIAPVP